MSNVKKEETKKPSEVEAAEKFSLCSYFGRIGQYFEKNMFGCIGIALLILLVVLAVMPNSGGRVTIITSKSAEVPQMTESEAREAVDKTFYRPTTPLHITEVQNARQKSLNQGFPPFTGHGQRSVLIKLDEMSNRLVGIENRLAVIEKRGEPARFGSIQSSGAYLDALLKSLTQNNSNSNSQDPEGSIAVSGCTPAGEPCTCGNGCDCESVQGQSLRTRSEKPVIDRTQKADR